MERRKSFLLRIDPGLWRELEAWAQDEFRSVNGQIEYVLRQAVSQRRGSGRRAPPDRGAVEASAVSESSASSPVAAPPMPPISPAASMLEMGTQD